MIASPNRVHAIYLTGELKALIRPEKHIMKIRHLLLYILTIIIISVLILYVITQQHDLIRYLKNIDYFLETIGKVGIRRKPIMEPYNADKPTGKIMFATLFRFREFETAIKELKN